MGAAGAVVAAAAGSGGDMPNRLFGEYLARVVHLSGHDVAEILEDQAASGRRFGEIALAWGLCQPEHVWEAWAHQLAHHTPHVNLRSIGVDVQATAAVPARLARRYRAIPIRTVGETLVVAVDESTVGPAAVRLPAILRRKMHFVVAPPDQIDAALDTYYHARPAVPPAPTPSN